MEKLNMVIGITGAINIIDITKYIIYFKEFFNLRIVLTDSAKKLISEEHVRFYCKDVYSEIFSENGDVPHVNLAQGADILIILPCTANTISKIASGMGDNLLSAICLNYTGKIHICPSMNQVMWENSIIRDNVNYLKGKGHLFHHKTSECLEIADGKLVISDATILEPKELLKSILKQDKQLYYSMNLKWGENDKL